jgi:hypothetical protein
MPVEPEIENFETPAEERKSMLARVWQENAQRFRRKLLTVSFPYAVTF